LNVSGNVGAFSGNFKRVTQKLATVCNRTTTRLAGALLGDQEGVGRDDGIKLGTG
jgi:hypothetical protein